MPVTSDHSIKNPVAYLVCAEGRSFEDVVAGLGGYVWGVSPMHLTGSHLVILPDSIELHCGEIHVGESHCVLTYVHRL